MEIFRLEYSDVEITSEQHKVDNFCSFGANLHKRMVEAKKVAINLPKFDSTDEDIIKMQEMNELNKNFNNKLDTIIKDASSWYSSVIGLSSSERILSKFAKKFDMKSKPSLGAYIAVGAFLLITSISLFQFGFLFMNTDSILLIMLSEMLFLVFPLIAPAILIPIYFRNKRIIKQKYTSARNESYTSFILLAKEEFKKESKIATSSFNYVYNKYSDDVLSTSKSFEELLTNYAHDSNHLINIYRFIKNDFMFTECIRIAYDKRASTISDVINVFHNDLHNSAMRNEQRKQTEFAARSFEQQTIQTDYAKQTMENTAAVRKIEEDREYDRKFGPRSR